MTPEEQAKQAKAVKDVRQQEYDKKQNAAAEKARQYTLGGVKEEPVKKAKGGTVKKYASGGAVSAALAKHAAKPASKAHAGLKAGGSVDGIAKKGKTKGTMIKMAGGGMYRKGGMCK